MISRIFIDRPIFAWVIAIVIMLLGIGGLIGLPVSQYPDIAPPSINIRATYLGASASTLESSVTQIIEQQLTGLDRMLYFQSTSNSAGTVQIAVTFDKGVNPDIAQVQVQNKVQQALPRLPQQVQQQGLVVTKSNADFLMVVAIDDESDRSSSSDIADYIGSKLQDGMARLPGVGDYLTLGAQYAMRIWLDPSKLSSFGLMPGDVIAAVQAQNAQIAAGQIGAQPSAPNQALTAIVTERTRLTSVDEFRKIIVKTQTDGSKVLLQDVARVELGSENYGITGEADHHPVSALGILLAPGADALKTAAAVRAYTLEASKNFPPGYKAAFLNDSSDFIKLSIKDVIITMFEAILLVVIVMFLFLQSWRATLIPAIAVPVVLLGTFGILAAAGFSINTLTLFGLVLSIGLLVDDAIVVVENVERVMAEDPDMTPREATIKSMQEINLALIAIAMVLSAVFLPMAFFGGSTGVIYRQFSITIVSSMALSVVVALILSPAIAANVLKRPAKAARTEESGLVGRLHHYGDGFNKWFGRTSDRYRNGVEKLFGQPRWAIIVFVFLLGVLVFVFFRLPTSFVPNEDQGYAQTTITLPPGATINRTIAAARTLEDYMTKKEGGNIEQMMTISGLGFAGQGQNVGRGFLHFTPWDQRKGQANSAEGITARITKAMSVVRDARIVAVTPPPIRGLGQSSGFTLELLNSANLDRPIFKQRLDALMREASADPDLSAVRLNVLEDAPTLNVQIDHEKAGALGLDQAAIDQTISVAWGGTYVNDFVDRGRVKRVYVQGDAPYRSRPEDISSWYVRTKTGQMVPFSAFARLSWGTTPNMLTRFNGIPSFEIQGQAAAGKSSGEAMKLIGDMAAKQPGTSIAWSGLSYQEQLSGTQAPLLYIVSLLVVFLCLAALYESWSIPLAVMLVIPLGLVGATLAVLLRGLENDIYFQVGLLTTMGLSAKNAILIVEFAEQAERQGKKPTEAVLEAAKIRLRPILMTSFAFMAGVIPLAISTGAGAKSRVAIGTAVFGGMLTATALAIFFVPLFFVLVRKFFPSHHHHPEESDEREGREDGYAGEARS